MRGVEIPMEKEDEAKSNAKTKSNGNSSSEPGKARRMAMEWAGKRLREMAKSS